MGNAVTIAITDVLVVNWPQIIRDRPKVSRKPGFPCYVDEPGWKAAKPKPGSQTSTDCEDERASLVVDLHPDDGVHLDPQSGGETEPQENGRGRQPFPTCLSLALGRTAGGRGRRREINWQDAGRKGRDFQWTWEAKKPDDKKAQFKKLWSEGWSHSLPQDRVTGLCTNKCSVYLEKGGFKCLFPYV